MKDQRSRWEACGVPIPKSLQPVDEANKELEDVGLPLTICEDLDDG